MQYPIYGLKYNPFSKEELRCIDHFETSDFHEMYSRLNYLKNVRGLGVFTASPGMGKTFCLHCFFESLDKNQYKMVYIPHSTVSIRDFYKEICISLDLDSCGGKPRLFNILQEQIVYMYNEQRCPLVLAIDEAHHLTKNILNDLKILMNHEYDSKSYFTIILVGEPSLNKTLNSPYFEALNQRVVVHYAFKGLTEEETRKYVSHKLKKAGGSDNIMDPAAINKLNVTSRGNARLIDNMMTYALNLGSQMKITQITPELIDAANNARKLGSTNH